MTYVSKPIGHPTGMHYPKVVERRCELRLDEKGFPEPHQPDEGDSEAEGSEGEAP